MDLSSHIVFYKMGRGHPFEKSHRSDRSKLHSRTYHYTVRDPQEIDQRQWDSVHKQRHEGLTEAYYIKHGRSPHTTHKEMARQRPLIG